MIMRRIVLSAAAALTLGVGWLTLSTNLSGQVPGPGNIVIQEGPGGPMMMGERDGRGNEFTMATKGAKEHDGFFKLYQKDDRVLIGRVANACGEYLGGSRIGGRADEHMEKLPSSKHPDHALGRRVP